MTSAASTSQSQSPSSSSSLQESDGIRKSGPIHMLASSSSFTAKKKGQPAYAVLSERALELHESEKAYRKRKGNRAIVDLSKCFNVSQQCCPKSKTACVNLLMPDECFLFRGENTNETTEWYCTLLSAVISARALNLGRPVFANEFFESVWDVTVCPTQPKLKRIPAPPNSTEFTNSPNICAKLEGLSGRKRLCFYPHTIILSKIGIEPAHSGLPKSGIPPFRCADFVEFSRHFIAQFGPVDKYFLMRIGRSSPVGSCEVWVQCDSEEQAAEINRKLQEIIQRETEKKQQALMAIRGQQQQQRHHQHGQSTETATNSMSNYSPTPITTAAASCALNNSNSPCNAEKGESLAFAVIEQLEPISEDEALTTEAGAKTPPADRPGRKKHSSLSQSAKEKRLELRECKAKVDSLEEEEHRFQQRQLMAEAQQQAHAGGGWSAKRYSAIRSIDPALVYGGTGASYNTAGCGTAMIVQHSRPNTLVNSGQPAPPVCGYQFRRRGSSGGMAAEITARSKSLSLEEQQAQNFRPFGLAGRLWTMDKADSLLLLGYAGPLEPTEETEDSGGTLRMIPCDQEGSGSQAPSLTSSTLNLATNAAGSGAFSSNSCSPHSASAGQLVETYVECHVPADESTSSSTSSDEEEKDAAGGQKVRRRKSASSAKEAQRRRQQQRQKLLLCGTGSGAGSLDGGAEADQSCSCSSSVASSSGQDEQQLADARVEKRQRQAVQSSEKQQQRSMDTANNNTDEYTLMDKVSCSSDSFPHLAVPQHHPQSQHMQIHPQHQYQQQQQFPEEICSYTSDSGDSCYSSMINGQLNPRAFSFSSTSDAPARSALHHQTHFGTNNSKFGSGGSMGGGGTQQHPAAAKWTAATMGGGQHHRQHLFHQPAHFSPSKGAGGHLHGCGGSGQPVESSSSSRFSMETSLITPLEEDERQVTFADEEQRDRLCEPPFSACREGGEHSSKAGGDDLLRKRAFSLGSKSWITKPFRKLSSAHGTPSSSSGGARQQRSSCGGASRSGSSSLVGSIHADLCSVQEQTSQTQLSSVHRLGSSSSFASSSAAAPIGTLSHHNRSDSIGSSHSAALSLPGRKKQPSTEAQAELDLVELEFMPSGLAGPFANRSTQCVASLSAEHFHNTRSPLRGRTNSCDDHNTSGSANNNNANPASHHRQQKLGIIPMGGGGANTPHGGGGTPRGRGSAGALNNHQTAAGGGHQRLRPSESFIRSIQQQQRELQRQRQQKQRQRLKTEFPLQEVQCFIAPAEREKIDAMTAASSSTRGSDTQSLRSQRSGSGSCSHSQHQFETIQECSQPHQSGQLSQGGSRPQSRRSLTKPISPSIPPPQSPLNEGAEEPEAGATSDYVLLEGANQSTKATVKA